MSAEVLRLRPGPEKDKIWEKVSHNLVVHRPSGVYYVRKSKAGKGRLFATTGTTKKGLAQTKADEMMAEWMGGQRESKRRARVGKLIDELDEILEREAHTRGVDGLILRRRKTRLKDGVYFPIVRKHFGEEFADAIDEAYWQRWCLTEGRRLDRNLGDIGKYLSKVLTYAFMTKAINRKPRIKDPDPKPADKVIYSPKEIAAFWNKAHVDLRDMIQLGARAGLRPTENREMRWDWVTVPARGQAKLRIPDEAEKRGQGREIFLPDEATAVLRRRMRTRRGPYVFPAPKNPNNALSECQLSRYWRRAVEAVNKDRIKAQQKPFPVGRDGGVRFHWLRHFFFNHVLHVAKKSLSEAASYGGNSPAILHRSYVDKDAETTKGVAGAVDLDLGNVD